MSATVDLPRSDSMAGGEGFFRRIWTRICEKTSSAYNWITNKLHGLREETSYAAAHVSSGARYSGKRLLYWIAVGAVTVGHGCVRLGRFLASVLHLLLDLAIESVGAVLLLAALILSAVLLSLAVLVSAAGNFVVGVFTEGRTMFQRRPVEVTQVEEAPSADEETAVTAAADTLQNASELADDDVLSGLLRMRYDAAMTPDPSKDPAYTKGQMAFLDLLIHNPEAEAEVRKLLGDDTYFVKMQAMMLARAKGSRLPQAKLKSGFAGERKYWSEELGTSAG